MKLVDWWPPNWLVFYKNYFLFSSVLSRVLEPSILFDMTFSNGEKKIFEVSISKFHQIRYSVASVLKEMGLMEKKKVFKISV
jgi:hypothetical protein